MEILNFSTFFKNKTLNGRIVKKFEDKRPEVVFEWKDEYTNAFEGWIVINSLRGGHGWWNQNENWCYQR